MSRSRSFTTLLWLVSYSLAMPVADDDDDDDSDGCWSSTTAPVHLPDSPAAAILAPYEHPPTPTPTPTPRPSPSQQPHATLPVSHRSQSPAILGTVFGILIALIAVAFAARYVIRRRRTGADPFKDPPKLFRFRSTKRLSDESWVSPALPSLGSPGSPLSHDLELRQYACKLVPVTTPVCTPTETDFGSCFGDVPVPSVRVPSPVYFSPFSPSPSLSSSPSSLSPAPSTEPLPSPPRLSRLLSSTFGDTPARPTTAHLIQTARAYANAYRPSSTTSTSLYTPPTPSVRLAGTRARTSFYPESLSTVTTSDTVPHLLRPDHPPSPFADPGPGTRDEPMGTSLGLKLRLSDASEHARYRVRERERERNRRLERGEADSPTVQRKEFTLRDSESVLREIGW